MLYIPKLGKSGSYRQAGPLPQARPHLSKIDLIPQEPGAPILNTTFAEMKPRRFKTKTKDEPKEEKAKNEKNRSTPSPSPTPTRHAKREPEVHPLTPSASSTEVRQVRHLAQQLEEQNEVINQLKHEIYGLRCSVQQWTEAQEQAVRSMKQEVKNQQNATPRSMSASSIASFDSGNLKNSVPAQPEVAHTDDWNEINAASPRNTSGSVARSSHQ